MELICQEIPAREVCFKKTKIWFQSQTDECYAKYTVPIFWLLEEVLFHVVTTLMGRTIFAYENGSKKMCNLIIKRPCLSLVRSYL